MAREQEVYLPDDLGEEKKPGKGKRIFRNRGGIFCGSGSGGF